MNVEINYTYTAFKSKELAKYIRVDKENNALAVNISPSWCCITAMSNYAVPNIAVAKMHFDEVVTITKAEFDEAYNKALEQIQKEFGGVVSNDTKPLLEIEQKANEIPNETVKAQWFANWNDDNKSVVSREKRNDRFLERGGDFSDAIACMGSWFYSNEGHNYWRKICSKINFDPTCSFLKETPKQEIQAKEGIVIEAIHISEIDKLRAKLTAQIHSGNTIGINDSLDRADRIINRVINVPFKRDDKMYV